MLFEKTVAWSRNSRFYCLILLSLQAALSLGAATPPPAPPEFLTAPSFAAGIKPIGIVSADFDGDGRLDVAVVNGGSDPGQVNVLLGNGSNGFSTPKSRAVGHFLTGIATADLNGDHLPDLVVSAGLGGFDVLLNRGGGNFHVASHVAGGSNAQSIVVGDFNADGHVDVALADSGGGGLIVFLGHGNGTFAAPKTFSSGTQFLHLAVADVNHDGKLDLITSTQTSIEVFLGFGNGNFGAPKSHVVAPRTIASFALGDFNRDGKLDLAVGLLDTASSPTQILSLVGRGDGTFTAPGRSFSAGPGYAVAMAVADFNRNGDLDLMIASGFDSVNVLSGNGDGTFHAPVLFGVGAFPYGIVLDDFNKDGKIDAITANPNSNSVSVLLANVSGGFQAGLAYVLGAGNRRSISGDVNGDNNIDLVTTGNCNKSGTGIYSVTLGNKDGTFQPPSITNTGTDCPISAILSDLNGDKVLDLAIVDYDDNDLTIYLGHGDGTFSPLTSYVVGAGPVDIVNADLNRDGIQDLVVTNLVDNTVSVLLGTGGGFFQPPVAYSIPEFPVSVAIAALKLHGNLDLIVANAGDNNLTLMLGRGDGTFFNGGTLATQGEPAFVRAADLTLDGASDLIVVNNLANSVSVFLNDGLGRFPSRVDYPVGLRPTFVDAKDLNGDGARDLVVSNLLSHSISVLKGNGTGTFDSRQDYQAGSAFTLTIGDFNHDGFLDIAALDHSSTVTVLLNTKH